MRTPWSLGRVQIAGILKTRRREGNPRAILAHKTFSYRVLKYIGAYAAAMNGADPIVHRGIGENDAHVRELIGTRLGYLGVTFDKEKNKPYAEKTILYQQLGH